MYTCPSCESGLTYVDVATDAVVHQTYDLTTGEWSVYESDDVWMEEVSSVQCPYCKNDLPIETLPDHER